jgi:hypothetical protein
VVVHLLRRKTAVAGEDEGRQRIERLLTRVRPLLERQPGFEGIELLLGDGGRLAEITRWRSLGDCRRYLREGAAATCATISDAMLPTAPYPDGTWWRETYHEG